MCRFMVYLGTPALLADLVTRPSHSLTRQSYNAKERLTAQGYLNGDGFGIGWYNPDSVSQGFNDPTPCVFSSIQPAWNNRNLARLADKIVSPLIFAHVRAAYPGIPVSDSNCQPFVCGRYMWMHNGGIGGFHLIRRKLLSMLKDPVFESCPSSESDSAISFSLFLNHIEDPMKELTSEELVSKMEATINGIIECCIEAGLGHEESLLNFAVSDGVTVVATRYTNKVNEPGASLYYASGTKFECVDAESNRYMVRHGDKRGQLGMVASEPLTEDKSDWIQVPRNTMVVMSRRKGQVVDLLLVPINPPVEVAKDISRSFKALESCTKHPMRISASAGVQTAGKSARVAPIPARIRVSTTPRHSFTTRHPILAIAVSGKRLFTGNQMGNIEVFDLVDFSPIRHLCGHSQTIFALTVHEGQLYSSSTRAVKVWNLETFKLVTTLRYSDGDVFALALAQGRAIAGPAGTSIIQCNRIGTATDVSGPVRANSNPAPRVRSGLSSIPAVDDESESAPVGIVPKPSVPPSVLPEFVPDDVASGSSTAPIPIPVSLSRYETDGESLFHSVTSNGSVINRHVGFFPSNQSASGNSVGNGTSVAPKTTICNEKQAALMLTDADNGGHCSRVYALVVCAPRVCSGAGDALVKVWNLPTGKCEATLHGHKGSVLALLAIKEANVDNWHLYSGSRDNTIRVWDLKTLSCITTLAGHTDDVVGLAAGHRNEFYSASADGTVRMWSLLTFECLQIFLHEESTFLSIACTENGVVTGSSDGVVRYWEPDNFEPSVSPQGNPAINFKSPGLGSRQESNTLMEQTLRKLVRLRSVSHSQQKSSEEQSWKAAKLLMGLLEALGAEAKLVVSLEGTNPVVFGRLIQDRSKLTVTICGHYDVEDASADGWNSDPFDLTAVDGNLYGRGVSDSKGPIIATLFAIKELISTGDLKVNLLFVLDGMQEAGCLGFREAVHSNIDWFEDTGLILSPNGAWISDDHPCLIYGMRGLICLSVTVTGPIKNLHSGKDGGAFHEPMSCLLAILSRLVDSSNVIQIPGFYDDVRPEGVCESSLYDGLKFDVDAYKAMSGLHCLVQESPKALLRNRWRNPSLSVVSIQSPTDSWSLIPKSCSAKVSIRHVPNQNPMLLVDRFKAFVAQEFSKLQPGGNQISVQLQHTGDWWLADPSCSFYKTAEQAIEKNWGVCPMYVREGHTMPVVPFLENVLGAPAMLLPISQATDHMALQNEKLRWSNFVKGKDVIRDFLKLAGEES